MSPAQKLRMVCDLHETGIEPGSRGCGAAHPDLPPKRLDFEACRSLLYAGTRPLAPCRNRSSASGLSYRVTGSVAASVYGERG
jgi:hypothetical protein